MDLSQTCHFVDEETEAQRGAGHPSPTTSPGSYGSEETGMFLVGLATTLCYKHGEKAPKGMLPDSAPRFPPWLAYNWA